ncbi:1-acyl-sn-glycerol-3-phosphate acyltransferase [bacterium]|nr:1-acyl-sn-glycerol-3-phosphate acyltransferase [bacterium]
MDALWYRLGQRFFGWLVRPYWPLRLEGLQHFPRQGAAILAGNHPTVLDGGLLGVFSPRRVRFLIDAKVLRIPVLGQFLKALGSIPVERGSLSLRHARQALMGGTCLGIYPEAAPTASPALGHFKKGVAVLARDVPGVPVVPVAVVGTLPLCSHQHLYAQPGPVTLRFGPALYWREGETLDGFLQRLRAALEELLLEPQDRPTRLTFATFLSGLVLAPPSAILLALSRRRFKP